jgi:hypothetical protein
MASPTVDCTPRPRRLFVWLAAALIAHALTAPLSAQWVHHPTADVPRKADGSPNLKAPAPRQLDGKPDFSGIWGTAVHLPCLAKFDVFLDCRMELPGSPMARARCKVFPAR